MGKKRNKSGDMASATVLEALDLIEPNLHHLDGLMKALQHLGEADDAIDQRAIASLARCALQTFDEIRCNWHTAISTLRLQ
jgi:hypothetical protein